MCRTQSIIFSLCLLFLPVRGLVTVSEVCPHFQTCAKAEMYCQDKAVDDGGFDRFTCHSGSSSAVYGCVTIFESCTGNVELNACALEPVVLGNAAHFAVFAGNSISNIGESGVTGHLGVYPGTSITGGFGPGLLLEGSSIHAANPTSAAGAFDLTTAYNDAAGRVLCKISKNGELGGRTLAPGLYTSTSGMAITSSDLSLDAGHDEESVWIFQTASALTSGPFTKIHLLNGAQASNIFWQVGSSCTLGEGSTFEGTIIADQSITLGTGAVVTGRVLARMHTASLEANIITLPGRAGPRKETRAQRRAGKKTSNGLSRRSAGSCCCSDAPDTPTVPTTCDLLPVQLGNAAHFVILAASTITNTLSTVSLGLDLGTADMRLLVGVVGDVGLSPGSSVTGFTPVLMINGSTIYTANSVAAAGQLDLKIAYEDAENRDLCPISMSILNDKTLTPGLYKSTSTMHLTGSLFLDGGGNPNAVWIFQMGSTFTSAAASKIVLFNEAQACNVFWQVGSSATLGADSIFQGTMMAYASITLGNGAVVKGRVLAKTAAVTSQGNGFMLPEACTTGPVGPIVVPPGDDDSNVGSCDRQPSVLVIDPSGQCEAQGGSSAQQPVVLGSAAAFAVLAAATVTNAGDTVVGGDLGVFPGTAVTGFGPGRLTEGSSMHSANSVSATAQIDLTRAYIDASSRTRCPVATFAAPGELAGKTLTPGLYVGPTTLQLAVGETLILDGEGNPDAVWIFKMGTSFVSFPRSIISLVNGAHASNIFWQVGSSGTIGVDTVFQGTMMADQSITLGTGAVVNGRVLARIAQVTLLNNVITIPCQLRALPVTVNPCSQQLVDLQSAAPFALLAASAITLGASSRLVKGNLGLSPGTAVTGYLVSTLSDGSKQVANPTASSASFHLTMAYSSAASRSLCATTLEADVGGLTKSPGLYKAASTLAITGILTLDAENDPDAVWIFQVGSAFNSAASSSINLINGAKSSNIFWQVGSSGTLGADSVFQGTMMAYASITTGARVNVNGRLLARIAAVTLGANNEITLPSSA